MAKNLQINLTFSADTTAAKQQIASLQQALSNAAAQPMQSAGINTMRQQIADAQVKALQLKTALQNATNVNTGKLNFNKFSQELKKSNMSLEQYAQALKRLGPQGTQAFAQLANAIRQSEMPIIALKGKVAALGKTLANTARWQISSMMLQGVMNAFSSTVDYAKELNESLNNIRIVTGKSVEDMSKFAKEANKAAKSLSATTTEYTNASLIYYQQGLSDAEVKKRAETTLKLAKVVGEEASTVSNWMTSIWNNFDNGAHSLEYYADVMTALGAATASSADEIAGGLEKFAAVAETVGLSYVYAASALATITSETRQSEDVVGTALKTIFARIEGLNLGETLEDGTTLNQYSEALYKIGVNIKDQNGNLKDMDLILNEIGGKWQGLNKDQQVALAQNVAGIRQYNQFIALMSNWDVMERNLEISKNATGELERQHEIYEEGIEGATARIQAQLENIKNTLLDEEDLLPILNIAEDFLRLIDNILDSIGGMPGLLIMLTGLLTRAFGPQIAGSISSITSGISSLNNTLNGSAAADRKTAITKSADLAADMAVSDIGIGDNESAAISGALKENTELTKEEERVADQINNEYKETLQLLRQIVEEKQKIIQESNKEYDNAVEQGSQAETALTTAGVSKADISIMRQAGNYQDQVDTFANTNFRSSDQVKKSAGQIVNTVNDTIGKNSPQATNLKENYEKLMKAELDYGKAKQQVDAKRKQGQQISKDELNQLKQLKTARKDARAEFAKVAKSVDVAGKAKKTYAKINQETNGAVDKLIDAESQGAAAIKRSDAATKDKDAVLKQHQKTLKEGVAVGKDWSQSFVNGISTMTSVASSVMMVTNSIKSVAEAAKNGELSFSTFLGAATSLLMGLGMFAPVITAISKAMKARNLEGIKGLGIMTAEWLMTNLTTKAKRDKIKAMQAESKEDDVARLKKIASIFFNIGEQASQGPKGWITAAISAALVAALIGVAIAVNAGNKAQNDEEEKEAQRTQKYAEEVSSAYDKVRESYEKLKESFENYKNAQDAIGKLQKGTLEWKQAIQEANQQVIELIDQYPELAQYVTNMEGRLVISDEGMNALLEQQSQQVTTLANIKADANLNAKKARYEADKKAALTTSLDTAGAGEFLGLMYAGSVLGNPITGTVAAIANNEQEYKASEEALAAITKAYSEQGETIFADFDKTLKELKITDPELIETLKENIDTVQELTRTNQELIEQDKIVLQQKTDNLLMSQSHFITSNYGQGVQEAATKEYEKLKQQGKEKWGTAEDYYGGASWKEFWTFGAAYGTDKGKAAFNEYAKLMGYEDAEATDFKGDKVVFKRKEGDEVKKDLEVTYEDIENALAEASAADQAYRLANTVNQMTSQVRILKNSSSSMEQALGAFFEDGNLGYLDPEIYDQIVNGNVQISEQQAALFGYDSVAAAEEAFSKALENYDATIARTNILAREQQAINTILADGAAELEQSETALRAYAETLSNSSQYLNENREAAAKMAVQHYRTAIGINELKKSLNDNLKVLEDSTANSLDYAEALGSVKDSLEKAFGIKVSAKFVEKNLEKIKAVANNDVEALRELRKELVEDFILNLAIDDEYKDALQSEIAELMEIAENNPIGMEIDFDNSKAIEGINQALEAGSMTVAEVEALFANANLALPQYNIAKVPHTTTTESHSEVTEPTWWGGSKTYSVDTSTTSTTFSDIPYFGDNPPVYEKNDDGSYTKKSGTGVESSFKVTTTANKDADQDILSYGGKGTEAAETQKEKEKRLKDLDKEKDRYHEINEIISDTERELNALGKAKDRAYGASKLALLDREIEKQKELIENNKELLRQAEDNVETDKKNLIKHTSSAYTLKFDEYGRIANYEEIENKYISRLKKEKVDPNSQVYKDLQEEYKLWKEMASQYEDSLNKFEEQTEKVNDETDALYEKSLEKIEYKVQIRTEIADDDKAYIDFMMQKLEDDAFAAADKIGLLGKEAENTLEKIAANQQGIADIEAAVANGDITPAQAVEKLREFRDEIIDLNADLQELRQTIQDNLTEAYEAWNEKIEKGISSLEFYGSVLSGYKNIIDIVGKDLLGLSDEAMGQLNQAIVSNANDTIRATKAQLDANNATLAKLKEARKKAEDEKDEKAVKAWDKQIEMVTEKSQELTTTLQDALATGLQAAADAFGGQVNQIADDFSKAVSGIYDSISDMRENWDRMGEVADRYLKTYEQAYQINKLNRQIEQSINSTDNVKAQRELKSLQSEMFDMTKDGQQMSKYDLEYLQKRYNLLLAEQALKDAQNAKSSARLVRDSSGNFGYVYTADQKNIDSAQQKYEDEAYAYQQYVDNMDQELTEMYISAQERMEERIRKAAEKYGEGTEEFKAAQKQIIEEYKQDIEYITNEYGKITERNLDINQRFSLGVADTYEKTFLGSILPNYKNFAALYDSTTQIAEDACGRLNQAVIDLRNTFKDQFDLAGEDFDDFADIANEKFGDIAQDSSDTADAVETMASDMDTALNGEGGAIDAVSTFYTEYSKKMEDVRNETGLTIGKVKDLIDEYQKLIDKATDAEKLKTPEEIKGKDNDGNNDGDPSAQKFHVGDAVDINWANRRINVLNRKITKAEYDKDTKTWKYQYEGNATWVPEKYIHEYKEPVSLSAPTTTPKPENKDPYPDSSFKVGQKIIPIDGSTATAPAYDDYTDRTDSVLGIKYDASREIFGPDNTGSAGSVINGPIEDVAYYDGMYFYKVPIKNRQTGETNQHVWFWGGHIKAAAYDTGGYTGTWGPEGRLAMLHQKEIVLNAHDTENFLTAIEIVRSIATQLENNALRTAQGLGSLVAAAAVNNNREVLEQNVTIHAEFPNATDHNEIELAFNDLINQASQYVNRR